MGEPKRDPAPADAADTEEEEEEELLWRTSRCSCRCVSSSAGAAAPAETWTDGARFWSSNDSGRVAGGGREAAIGAARRLLLRQDGAALAAAWAAAAAAARRLEEDVQKRPQHTGHEGEGRQPRHNDSVPLQRGEGVAHAHELRVAVAREALAQQQVAGQPAHDDAGAKGAEQHFLPRVEVLLAAAAAGLLLGRVRDHLPAHLALLQVPRPQSLPAGGCGRLLRAGRRHRARGSGHKWLGAAKHSKCFFHRGAIINISSGGGGGGVLLGRRRRGSVAATAAAANGACRGGSDGSGRAVAPARVV
jgi:hypothetical protein